MAISFDSIKKTKHATPPRLLLHGNPKTGKSTFSASAPNPIFIRTEDGLNGIDTNAFDLAGSFSDVKEALMLLATQPHEFKTVVIDSADWLEKIIHDEICSIEKVKTVAKAGGGFGNGYNIALSQIKEVLRILDDLNRRLKMIVIVICHSQIQTINDVETESYDIATLKLHKTASALFSEWADVIGYAKRPILVSKNESGDYKAREIGVNPMNELVIGTTGNCLSGNRYSLPSKIPLSWQAFQDAMKNSMTTTQQ